MKRKRNVNESSIFLRNLYKFYIVIWEAHDLLLPNILGCTSLRDSRAGGQMFAELWFISR